MRISGDVADYDHQVHARSVQLLYARTRGVQRSLESVAAPHIEPYTLHDFGADVRLAVSGHLEELCLDQMDKDQS